MLVDEKGNKVVSDEAVSPGRKRPRHMGPFPKPGFYLGVVPVTDDMPASHDEQLQLAEYYGPFHSDPDLLVEGGRINERADMAGLQPPVMFLVRVDVLGVLNDVVTARAGRRVQQDGLRMVEKESTDD